MKWIKNNLLTLGILFLSFIHLYTPLFFKNNHFSLVVNTSCFLIVLIYLLKKTNHQKVIFFLIGYFLIEVIYLITIKGSFFINVSQVLTFFSLPLFILFFSNLPKKANHHQITFLFVFFFILSLFLQNGDELNLLNLIFLPFILTYAFKSHSYLLKMMLFVLIFLTTLRAKNTLYTISLLTIIVLFCFINYKKILKSIKKNELKSLVFLAMLLGIIALSIPNIEGMSLIKEKTFSNLFSELDLSSSSILLGGHFSLQNNNDALNLFASLGGIGCLVYTFLLIYIFIKIKRFKNNKLALSCLLVLSFVTKNTLTNSFLILLLSFLFLKIDKKKEDKDVLLVSNMYPSLKYPHYGIFVKNTYDLLINNSYKVDLVVMHKQDSFINKFLSYLKLVSFSFFKAIFNNYNYIYVHFASHSPIGVFLPYLFSKETKLVMNTHGNDIVPDQKEDERYLFISRLSIKLADVVVAPSFYFKNILLRKYNVPKNKLVVYPSGGVDIVKFHKIPKKEAQKKLNLDSKTKYFAFVGRIEKDKGYDTLIKAMNHLKKKEKLKNIKFILVGSGREENQLNDLIKKYKLEKSIIRKPLVDQQELVYIYNSVEALVYPTRRKSESLGLTGLEAMACETLVIGSNKYGPSDYLKNNENSLTFNPSDDLEVADKIIEALNMSEKEKNKLTNKGRKTALSYSLENTKALFLSIFKN